MSCATRSGGLASTTSATRARCSPRRTRCWPAPEWPDPGRRYHGQVITFGQTARCDTADELSQAAAAGVTSVICEPDLAAAALDLGLVPLRESAADAGGIRHTTYTIQPGGEPSWASLDAAVAHSLAEPAAVAR